MPTNTALKTVNPSKNLTVEYVPQQRIEKLDREKAEALRKTVKKLHANKSRKKWRVDLKKNGDHLTEFVKLADIFDIPAGYCFYLLHLTLDSDSRQL